MQVDFEYGISDLLRLKLTPIWYVVALSHEFLRRFLSSLVGLSVVRPVQPLLDGLTYELFGQVLNSVQIPCHHLRVHVLYLVHLTS